MLKGGCLELRVGARNEDLELRVGSLSGLANGAWLSSFSRCFGHDATFIWSDFNTKVIENYSTVCQPLNHSIWSYIKEVLTILCTISIHILGE